MNFKYINFFSTDIIICKDRTTNKFIEPPGFQGYVLGDVMFPPKVDNLHFYAFTVVHWSNTIRDTSLPFGHLLMKKRQLEKIGFTSFFVSIIILNMVDGFHPSSPGDIPPRLL